jgi:hypothetical protein
MDIANERVAKGGVPFVDASRCWLCRACQSLLLFPGEADGVSADAQRGVAAFEARFPSAAHLHERAAQHQSQAIP